MTNFATIIDRGIDTGSVVSLDGSRRLYAVTHVDCTGLLGLVALSGGFRGCAPSGVGPERLTVIPGARVEFTGAKRSYLAGRYGMAVRMMGSRIQLVARANDAAASLNVA